MHDSNLNQDDNIERHHNSLNDIEGNEINPANQINEAVDNSMRNIN